MERARLAAWLSSYIEMVLLGRTFAAARRMMGDALNRCATLRELQRGATS